jgi:hypothetical protein
MIGDRSDLGDTTPGRRAGQGRAPVGGRVGDQVGRVGMRWRRAVVRGPSMSPTLADGDVVLVTFGVRPEAGDLVLARWAARPGQLSVKRAVRPAGGADRPDGAGEEWEVHGDNPFGSTDSRQLGPAEVLGVVRRRLWPRPRRL